MRQIEITELKKRSDERGWLVEVLRGEGMGERNEFGQILFP